MPNLTSLTWYSVDNQLRFYNTLQEELKILIEISSAKWTNTDRILPFDEIWKVCTDERSPSVYFIFVGFDTATMMGMFGVENIYWRRNAITNNYYWRKVWHPKWSVQTKFVPWCKYVINACGSTPQVRHQQTSFFDKSLETVHLPWLMRAPSVTEMFRRYSDGSLPWGVESSKIL